MSVFQVQLTQLPNSQILGPGPYLWGSGSTAPIQSVMTSNGSMDTWAQSNAYAHSTVNGVVVGTGGSVQRTMFCMGPNKINRKLRDGQCFVDCNYWKQFCAAPVGPMAPDQAFIAIITDDGSTYVPGMPSTFVHTYTKTILSGTTFTTANNIVNVLGDNGGSGIWATITNNGSNSINVMINGVTGSTFPLTNGTSQTFNYADITQINTIAFQNNASGAANANVEVMVGVLSQCTS